jgi:signal transduction histidine kinase
MDIINETKLNNEQMGFIHTMHALSDHLSSLISEIADFSKIKNGKVSFGHHVFDLKGCLLSIHRISEIKSKLKGVKLTLEADGALPSYVMGDMSRIRQICINILDNAIKFTPCGGHVRFKVTEDTSGVKGGDTRKEPECAQGENDNSNLCLCFTITDNGIGISSHELPHIFNSFTQAEMSSTRSHGGTGLGLSICHNLALLMNGTIDVESEKGKGTTFYVRIHVRRVADPMEVNSHSCLLQKLDSQKSLKSNFVFKSFDKSDLMTYLNQPE